MPDLVHVEYAQTGQSTAVDSMGMREMQVKAFAKRESQYLLIKAPPASGKSRALMYIGLDKLYNQGLKKVIVAVPERSIGRSFASTPLTESGFFADWEVADRDNLCTPGSEQSKVAAVPAIPRRARPDPGLHPRDPALRARRDRREAARRRRSRDRRVPPRLQRREQPARRAAALGHRQHRMPTSSR